MLNSYLKNALKKKSWKEAYPPIFVLMSVGPKASPAIPALIQTLKITEKALKRSKLSNIEIIMKEATEKVGPYNTRLIAITTLGIIGPAARQALPELKKALNDKYPEMRNAAKEAIKEITAPPKP